ncbi:DUF3048 domain-containing protein [Petroclostridium sp. X23]|uniref:DUF3048 domain-containing protein n=1 Tax=Petroclostridium sp. X23 TaxID=3045146 RepID=UPI0024ADB05E|nr:DUF3048 domain-containing protein [Petroclostridium sp. X23]WHH61502.1 DUF3048 domain-containing protein [Petroclostridium sp. X23]
MKKLLHITTAFLLFAMLSGCTGTKTNEPPTQQQPAPKSETAISDSKPDPAPSSPPTDPIKPSKKFMNTTNERPIAVMIDNDNSDAWPHAGLEEAYVIYETIVEGGSTRFMALFKGTDTKKIGPVRSSRHYFLDYAMENDAVYVHYGWSPKARKDIPALKINNINGVLGGDDWIFWREPKRKWDYHDVYTSIEKIKEMMKQKKYRDTSEVQNFQYASSELTLADGASARKIEIPYSRYHTTAYEYDETAKLYKRWMRGTPHALSTSDNAVSTKNIIIQYVKNYYLGDGEPNIGRQQLDTVGTGTGYYITNGKTVKINWKKDKRSSKTLYTDEQGHEIQLNDGQTWIQITPINANVVFE